MTDETTQVERISSMIDAFAIAFGSARAAIYCFPNVHDHSAFVRYLGSFLSLLRRADLRPVYSWSFDSNRDCYNFILVVNGYFRNDVRDITEAAQRIWRLYSTDPIELIADIPIKADTLQNDKERIFNTLFSSSFFPKHPQKILPSHQRAFSCSRVN